jgi:hypothetical protein
VRGKNEWWYANNEVHRAEVKGPYPHGDRFALFLDYDFSAKAGPMAGQRLRLQEVAVFTVKGRADRARGVLLLVRVIGRTTALLRRGHGGRASARAVSVAREVVTTSGCRSR